jgi:hypothetical protein
LTLLSEDPYFRFYPVESKPDIDGDGVREIMVGYEWILPATVAGTVKVEEAGRRLIVPLLAGDQTGDGTADYFWIDTVFSGPLSYDAEDSLTSATAAVAPEDNLPTNTSWVVPMIDLGGDGSAEFWAAAHDVVGGGGDALLYTGGPDGSFFAGDPTLRLRAPSTSATFEGLVYIAGMAVDDGRALWLAPSGAGLTIVDVGDATPLDTD